MMLKNITKNTTNLKTFEMEKMIDLLPAAILIFAVSKDKEASVVYISKRVEEVSGEISRQVESIKDLLDCIIEADYEETRLAAEYSLNTMNKFDKIFRIVNDAREIRWGHLVAEPSPQPDGSCLFYGIYTDITDQKRIEEQRNISQAKRLERYHNFISRTEEDENRDLAMKVHIDGTANKLVSWWSGEDGYQLDSETTLWSFRDYILKHAFSEADRQALYQKIDFDTIVKDFYHRHFHMSWYIRILKRFLFTI